MPSTFINVIGREKVKIKINKKVTVKKKKKKVNGRGGAKIKKEENYAMSLLALQAKFCLVPNATRSASV